LDVPALLETLNSDVQSVKVMALIDSGCTGSVIDTAFARANGFEEKPLDRPFPVVNADGSRNRAGMVTSYVELVMTVQGHREVIPLAVAQLGEIQFERCPLSCSLSEDDEEEHYNFMDEGLEADDELYAFDFKSYSDEQQARASALYTRAFQTHASRIAEQQAAQRKEQTFAERVPAAYHDYKDI
ncbi:hypothetical protein PENSPDRAFT_549004, partial [Peniophora sp. CONT]